MKTLKTFVVTLAFLGLSVSAAMSQTYVITATGALFNAHKGLTAVTTGQPIQTVIEAIKADAAGANCTIQFGDGGVLDLGGGSTTLITFEGNWGLITLTGKATTACTSSTTICLKDDNSIDCKAELTATANSDLIYNDSNGTITVSSGIVQTMGLNRATVASHTGTINISGGTVQATGKGGMAVYTNYGTINISGGTVSATDDNGMAVFNFIGVVNISGGTVSASATTGIAVFNSETGKITVSGTALVTSANIEAPSGGTIVLYNTGTETDVRLEITGGTVENTASGGIVICNNSTGAIDISGGMVSATVGYAVFSVAGAPGAINISGGTVSVTNGYAVASLGEINISGGTVQATGESAVSVAVYVGGEANISGGTVSAPGYEGIAVGIVSTGKTTISGTALVTSGNLEAATGGTIYLTDSGTETDVRLKITGGTVENTSIEDWGGVAIHNTSTGAIDISGGTVSVTDNFGYTIYNYGTGAITVSGGTVSTSGEEGSAIYNVSTGAVNISGGTLQATSFGGKAIYNASTGTITISNGTLQATGNSGIAIHNASTGAIDISGGTVSATGDEYGTAINNYGAGTITISGGMILAKDYYAIHNTHSGTVSIGSGSVFAYGTAETDVINGTFTAPFSHNAVIVAWNEEAGKTTYEAGTSEDIYKLPAEATAVWAKQSGSDGISVANGTNMGFIPLAGVTVGTTGIEAITNDGLRIYPNPTSDILNFSVETPFEIIDLQGRTLLKSNKGVKSVNINSLPSGTYFVILTTERGKVVKKVIKE